MQVGAINEQALELPSLGGPAESVNVGGGVAAAGPLVLSSRLERGEVLGLVLLSIVLHAAVAFRLTRPASAMPRLQEQQVEIEFTRPPPPPPPVETPPAATREQPSPVLRKVEPRRAEPRTVAKLEPLVPSKPAAPNELPALPVGDEPSLAMASGKGTGEVTTPPPPPIAVRPTPPPPPVAAHEGANYLKNPRPAYPEIALRRGWEGDVLLRVRVSPDGRPASISVQKSSGRDLLDQAAVDAVRGWTFVPARQGGEAVAGWVSVPIVFHLQ
jgi:periplasmic protein TonB